MPGSFLAAWDISENKTHQNPCPYEQTINKKKGEGVHCANDRGKNFTGKGNGRCKGPMAATYLASPRNGAEARGVKKR